jgi:hypothetical protein
MILHVLYRAQSITARRYAHACSLVRLSFPFVVSGAQHAPYGMPFTTPRPPGVVKSLPAVVQSCKRLCYRNSPKDYKAARRFTFIRAHGWWSFTGLLHPPRRPGLPVHTDSFAEI